MELFLLSIITLMSTFGPAQKNNSTKSENMTDNINKVKMDTATFGTGCFWCTEAIFQQVEGVSKVTSGYSGGKAENPSYKQVCSGTTGHAECLNIVYDPSKITFDELLEIFWQVHDPTTLNKQGNDVGTQYRSVVFYHDAGQKAAVEKYKAALDKSGAWDNPVVTTLEPFVKFYPAEDYHQNYYNDNTGQGYCQFVIRPKVEKFQKVFKSKLKKH
ncbi:MAG: peptide-methionine (S)-S-oxide reductase MsrA [Ferruginibacter sp.]